MVRPVAAKWLMKEDDVAALQTKAAALPSGPNGADGIGLGGLDVTALLAWLAVGIPIAWGVWIALQSAVKIF